MADVALMSERALAALPGSIRDLASHTDIESQILLDAVDQEQWGEVIQSARLLMSHLRLIFDGAHQMQKHSAG